MRWPYTYVIASRGTTLRREIFRHSRDSRRNDYQRGYSRASRRVTRRARLIINIHETVARAFLQQRSERRRRIDDKGRRYDSRGYDGVDGTGDRCDGIFGRGTRGRSGDPAGMRGLIDRSPQHPETSDGGRRPRRRFPRDWVSLADRYDKAGLCASDRLCCCDRRIPETSILQSPTGDAAARMTESRREAAREKLRRDRLFASREKGSTGNGGFDGVKLSLK